MPIHNTAMLENAPPNTTSVNTTAVNTAAPEDAEHEQLMISENDIAKLDRYSTARSANTNSTSAQQTGLVHSWSSAFDPDNGISEYAQVLSGIGQSVYQAVQNNPTGPMPKGLESRWSEFTGRVFLQKGAEMDINAFIQAVLREAYMENTQDLHFYAQKVKYYNAVKKNLRNKLIDLRSLLTNQAGREGTDKLIEDPDVNPPVETQIEMRIYQGVFAKGWDSKIKVSTDDVITHLNERDSIYDLNQDGAVGADDVAIAQSGESFIPQTLLTPKLDENGQPEYVTTKDELDTYITNLEETLNGVGDDAQLANVDLQNMLQKQQQTLQMLSNIAKMLHDTAMAVIRKIGG
jgi:hypothetical protein